MGVMIEKQPTMRIPDLTDPECSSFGEYEKYPHIVSLDISEEDVQWVATRTTGAVGTIGIDALAFKIWLLPICTSSESLR